MVVSGLSAAGSVTPTELSSDRARLGKGATTGARTRAARRAATAKASGAWDHERPGARAGAAAESRWRPLWRSWHDRSPGCRGHQTLEAGSYTRPASGLRAPERAHRAAQWPTVGLRD